MPRIQDISTRPPGTATRGHWLFLVAILTGPFFLSISNLALLLYIIVLTAQVPWRSSLADRRVATVGLCLLLCCCWLVARTGYPYGTGLHTLVKPFRFPVSVLDYVPFLIFFFARSVIPISPREVRRTLWALVAANLLRFPVAIAQKYFSWICRCTWEVAGLPVVRLLVNPMQRGRVDAGFANGNVLACSLVFCLLAAIALVFWYLPGRQPPSESQQQRPLGRLLVLLVLAAALLCTGAMLLWSGSRNSWAVLALVLPVLFRVAGLRWRYILVPLLLVLLLIAVSVVELGAPTEAARSIVPKIVWGRLIGLPELKPSRLSWRVEVFSQALDLIEERPLTGWGIGNFAPEAERRTGFPLVNHAHNIFLQLAAEAGVPFTVLLTGIIGAIFLATGRRLRTLPRDRWRTMLAALYLAAVAMVLLHQLSLTMLHANQLEMVFWWCLAVPYSLALTREPTTDQSAYRNRSTPLL